MWVLFPVFLQSEQHQPSVVEATELEEGTWEDLLSLGDPQTPVKLLPSPDKHPKPKFAQTEEGVEIHDGPEVEVTILLNKISVGRELWCNSTLAF